MGRKVLKYSKQSARFLGALSTSFLIVRGSVKSGVTYRLPNPNPNPTSRKYLYGKGGFNMVDHLI